MSGQVWQAGVAGFNQGLNQYNAREDRTREIARQAEQDQWAREDRVGVQADAAQERELRGMEIEDVKMSRKQKGLMTKLTSAYQSRNPQALDDLYASIPDGQDLVGPTTQLPDGRFLVNHPTGKIVGTWDEIFFGKPRSEGGGETGLAHWINPGAILTGRFEQDKADRKQANAVELQQMKGDQAMGVAKERSRGSAAAAGARRNAAGVSARVQIVPTADGYAQFDPTTGAFKQAQMAPVGGVGPPEQMRVPSRQTADPVQAAVGAIVRNRRATPAVAVDPNSGSTDGTRGTGGGEQPPIPGARRAPDGKWYIQTGMRADGKPQWAQVE